MKTFRTLEQAKRDLQKLQEYVNLIENYQPQDFAQVVVFTYSLFGNIEKTAEYLNQNYLINGRSIEPKEISYFITSTPAKDDLLHKKIKTLYLKKTRANRRTSRNPFQYN
ncbi:hypothetical protein [Lysinibacillus antri]|uniref:Uncharacterized protein n=1 Tax=Lysinibacillus antri TaxID=2498145 RepID=A0A3S0QND0_9BACI|nr:hypothetical protein [Lysinibacillus antri]RUL48778.1 hypothetical protein EK386_16195 [Lysinibacillus antri]